VLEVQDMQAETTAYHYPAQPYRYAVEANQGWFTEHKLTAGSTVNLPGALAPLRLPTGTPLAIPPPPPPPPPLPPASATP
jgi:hypothetical protein